MPFADPGDPALTGPDTPCAECGIVRADHDAAEAEWADLLDRLDNVQGFLADDPDRVAEYDAVEQAQTLVRTHAMPACHPRALT